MHTFPSQSRRIWNNREHLPRIIAKGGGTGVSCDTRCCWQHSRTPFLWAPGGHRTGVRHDTPVWSAPGAERGWTPGAERGWAPGAERGWTPGAERAGHPVWSGLDTRCGAGLGTRCGAGWTPRCGAGLDTWCGAGWTPGAEWGWTPGAERARHPVWSGLDTRCGAGWTPRCGAHFLRRMLLAYSCSLLSRGCAAAQFRV